MTSISTSKKNQITIRVKITNGLLVYVEVKPSSMMKKVLEYTQAKSMVYSSKLKDYQVRKQSLAYAINYKSGVFLLPEGLLKPFITDLFVNKIISKDDLEMENHRIDKFSIDLIDKSSYAYLTHKKVGTIQLRSYQQEALETLLMGNIGIVAHPTGSGKGEIITALCKILQPYGQVLVLAFSAASLQNIASRLEDYDIDYCDYHHIRRSEPKGVIISTPKVLFNDLNSGHTSVLDSIRYVISNEVHHAKGNQWFHVVSMLKNVVRSYGFSATPEVTRSTTIREMSIEEARVRGTHGPIVHERQSLDTDVKDFVSVPQIVNLRYDPSCVSGEDMFQFSADIIKKYVNDPERLAFICSIVKEIHNRTGYSTITFISEKKKQGDILLQKYPPCSAVWYGGGYVELNSGETISVEHLVKEVCNGTIRHLIITSHAREDINLPILNIGIMLELSGKRPVKQCIGRVVRKGTPSYFLNIADSAPQVLAYQAKNRAKHVANEYGSGQISFYDIKKCSDFFENEWQRFKGNNGNSFTTEAKSLNQKS